MPSPGEDVQAWSTTALTNANSDPLINWAEGQPRASVNNSARSMLAAHAKDRNLKNGSIVTAGSANAQTFTSGVGYTAPIPTGLRVLLKIGITNTDATTLNMDGIGDTPIKDQIGKDIVKDALTVGHYVEFLYDGTNWIIMLTSGRNGLSGSPGSGATPGDATVIDALAFNGMQVNGSMDVSQENGTTAVAVTSGYSVDCWTVNKAGSMAVSAQQVADAPPGYVNSLKIAVTTAQASLGASDYANITTPIEGFRTARLQFGTAAAQIISIAFWSKIHRPGIYSGSIRNAAVNRAYPFTFTQNAADVWEYKTVTIPGDMTGTWVGGTNGIGLLLTFAMAAGTAFLGPANVWGAGNFTGANTMINGVAATSDTFQITGVLVLPGIDLPDSLHAPFVMRPFDEELPTCKRYYEQSWTGASPADGIGAGIAISMGTGRFGTSATWPVEKRTNPAVFFRSPLDGAFHYVLAPGVANVAMSTYPAMGMRSYGPFFDTTTVLPIGTPAVFHWVANARL